MFLRSKRTSQASISCQPQPNESWILNWQVKTFVWRVGSKPIPKKVIFDENGPSTSRGRPEEQIVCTDTAADAGNLDSGPMDIAAPELATMLSKDCARRSGLESPLPKRSGLKRIDPYLNLEMIFAFVELKVKYLLFRCY